MCQVNNNDTRMATWLRSGVFIVNFEHISRLVLVFLFKFEHVIAGWERYLTGS